MIRFFKEENGLLHQKRADEELRASQTRKESAVAKATLAAEKRWGRKSPGHAASDAPSMLEAQPEAVPDGLPDGLPGAVPEQCPSPSPSPTTSKVSGDVNLSGNAGAAAHATSHPLNQTTGEENPRPVQLAILLRKTYGMAVTSNHADVTEMVRLAVSDQEIAEAVEVFGMKKPNERPNAGYILGIIRSAREQAAKAAAAVAGKPADPATPTQTAAEWWNSIEGIKAKAAELSVAWKVEEGELFMSFKVRVFKRAGEGPWRQQLLRETERDEAMHARILAFFYPSEQEAA